MLAFSAGVDRLPPWTRTHIRSARDLDALADGVLADRALVLRRLADRLEGHWLRTRLRMGTGAANRAVRTARAVFRGPLSGTAQALTAGAISLAHAAVLADGTRDLAAPTTTQAEPVLLEAARQLDPSQLRRALGHLRGVADPDREHDRTEQCHGRRGLWISPTFEGMVALQGQLDPEAGQTLLAALEPFAAQRRG
jgi:hypothetical protein